MDMYGVMLVVVRVAQVDSHVAQVDSHVARADFQEVVRVTRNIDQILIQTVLILKMIQNHVLRKNIKKKSNVDVKK
jgi:hypothetical protein